MKKPDSALYCGLTEEEVQSFQLHARLQGYSDVKAFWAHRYTGQIEFRLIRENKEASHAEKASN